MKHLMISLALVAPVASAYTVNADSDTCWSPPDYCIQASASWSAHDSDKLIVRYTNTCQHRIYLKYCHTRMRGGEDCGASGISGGSTKSSYTYNASGQYGYRMIGVLKPSKDWVCSSKVSGW
ncbi:hypothetical protein [Salinisphaera sp.]|uniref:hypothetical protein n=1 Tax=Salinisphaera sp. TaxID=1914330 RepID=UPI000C388816|nr:hypothetical protein [Salinisphaera sp.]MAS10887.1 hypothetical protein [Salinisphaera sp.]|tara:strand:- start:1658 stop:2023 length:366 start_codon:yes stop_codon:yes gene_type:complete